MNFDSINQKLNELIKEAKDEALIEKLGVLKNDVNTLKASVKELEDKHIRTVELYGEAIAAQGTSATPKTEQEMETPPTLEELVNQLTPDK